MWPNSDQLTLSEVSECGSFMAMGLRNGTVVVWDIYRGEGFVCVLLFEKKKFIKMPFSSSFVGHRHNLTERGRITITLELPLSIINECKIDSINQYICTRIVCQTKW